MSIQFSSCRLIIKCLLINLWIYCEDWPPPDPLWRPSLPHKNFTECLWGEKLYMSGISLWNRWENYGKNNQRFDNDSYSLFFLPPPPPLSEGLDLPLVTALIFWNSCISAQERSILPSQNLCAYQYQNWRDHWTTQMLLLLDLQFLHPPKGQIRQKRKSWVLSQHMLTCHAGMEEHHCIQLFPTALFLK